MSSKGLMLESVLALYLNFDELISPSSFSFPKVYIFSCAILFIKNSFSWPSSMSNTLSPFSASSFFLFFALSSQFLRIALELKIPSYSRTAFFLSSSLCFYTKSYCLLRLSMASLYMILWPSRSQFAGSVDFCKIPILSCSSYFAFSSSSSNSRRKFSNFSLMLFYVSFSVFGSSYSSTKLGLLGY